MATEAEDFTDLDEVQVEEGDDLDVVVLDEEAAPEEAAPEAEEATPEEAAPEAEEAAPEEDAELAGFPDKVKARFAREKRLRDQIIRERDQVRDLAVQAAEQISRRDTELATLRQQNVAIQRQFAETLEYAYDRDIQLKADAVRKAREGGNYDDELKAQSELEQLRFQQIQVRQAKHSIPEAAAVPESAPAPRAAPQATAPTPPPPLAVKWVEANKTWLGSPKFAAHAAFVRTADAQISAEGYDKHSKEYYEELDRRVDAAFPSLRKRPQQNGSPVAPAKTLPGKNTSKKTVTLTRNDLQNMQSFGLDVHNKEHLREYARSKRA